MEIRAFSSAGKISHQLHSDLTPTSTHFRTFIPQGGNDPPDKGGSNYVLGMEWYWWLLIVVALVICIPFKVKFMKWWSKREQEKKKNQTGKWGDEDDRS